jgi:hypothetical protein
MHSSLYLQKCLTVNNSHFNDRDYKSKEVVGEEKIALRAKKDRNWHKSRTLLLSGHV